MKEITIKKRKHRLKSRADESAEIFLRANSGQTLNKNMKEPDNARCYKTGVWREKILSDTEIAGERRNIVRMCLCVCIGNRGRQWIMEEAITDNWVDGGRDDNWIQGRNMKITMIIRYTR